MNLTSSSEKSLQALNLDQQEDAAFRARDRAWAAVIEVFDRQVEQRKTSYAQLGKRIGRSRAQVQRWLASPFNMNLRSLGLLAEGLGADLIIDVRLRSILDASNWCHPSEAARATLASRGLTMDANSVQGKTHTVTTVESDLKTTTPELIDAY